MVNTPISKDGTIFPISLAIDAIRNSGYRNTAYALAELIDNSVQAGASLVEVIFFEKTINAGKRSKKRIQEIAVIDNGSGMNDDVLRAALMFGNGTRLNDRSGIGRFGVGLPNASLSQCKTVELWSWENGVANSLYTHIDFEEMQNDRMLCVPIATHKKIPVLISNVSKHDFSTPGGTLVLWSNLEDERMTWKTSQGTIKHTARLAGRIYRHLISESKVAIQLTTYNLDDDICEEPILVLPNDPLYLSIGTNTPVPFDKDPMFQLFGEPYGIDVEWKGVPSKITITCSYAKEKTFEHAGTRDRGHAPYGKHANDNVGVSLVRAKRELLIDPSWANHSDPRDRWWGCEVAFSPDLDDVFGVVNNKQEATNWGQFAQLDWEDFREEENESLTDVIKRMQDEDDPRSILIVVSKYIKDQIDLMRGVLRDQGKGRRGRPSRHEQPDAPDIEDKASDKTKERSNVRPTDRDNESFDDAKREQYAKDLVDKGYSEDVAIQKAELVLTRQRRIDFIEEDWDSDAFFQITLRTGGLSVVSLNSSHLFFQRLKLLLNQDDSLVELTPEEAIEQLQNTSDVLHLLFAAWARYEEEANEDTRKRLTSIRRSWGAMVNFYLDEEGFGSA